MADEKKDLGGDDFLSISRLAEVTGTELDKNNLTPEQLSDSDSLMDPLDPDKERLSKIQVLRASASSSVKQYEKEHLPAPNVKKPKKKRWTDLWD